MYVSTLLMSTPAKTQLLPSRCYHGLVVTYLEETGSGPFQVIVPSVTPGLVAQVMAVVLQEKRKQGKK